MERRHRTAPIRCTGSGLRGYRIKSADASSWAPTLYQIAVQQRLRQHRHGREASAIRSIALWSHDQTITYAWARGDVEFLFTAARKRRRYDLIVAGVLVHAAKPPIGARPSSTTQQSVRLVRTAAQASPDVLPAPPISWTRASHHR